jgi:5-methylcytosine-specific restriction endonuclease McrA
MAWGNTESERQRLRDKARVRNKRKGEFLGQPYGTACGKLRKKLLHKYIVLAGDGNCHRCGQPIEWDDLSVEHIKAWHEVSVDLFWDLDNIMFSHQRCNSLAGRD